MFSISMNPCVMYNVLMIIANIKMNRGMAIAYKS